MNYQVLARKWRPRSFATLVGQEHVVRALTHALDQQRLHHAWLFTGTRGVGKTTLSRILAKALNCIGPQGDGGITSQPCGVCRPCMEIDAGRFIDYIEMDAASNRGVDEMAQLLEKAVYSPSVGRFKVYMIDEVHMLTNHAFNAMLKTLEEPPEHVKFILATTDPQKIPVTVLSRCLQFNLKQMPAGHIVSHLAAILDQEGVQHELNALRLLARAAAGSMRDALSLTDQAIAYGAGHVDEAQVRAMLGALDQSYLLRLLDALMAEDGAAMLAVADELAARSLPFSSALQDLGSLLHKIALTQRVPQAASDDWPEVDAIRRLAAQMDAQEVQLFYQIANHGRQELSLAPDEQAGFTMTLLRMLAFRPMALSGGGGMSTGTVEPPKSANTGGQGRKSARVQENTAMADARTGAPPPVRQTHEPVSLSSDRDTAHAEPFVAPYMTDSGLRTGSVQQVKEGVTSAQAALAAARQMVAGRGRDGRTVQPRVQVASREERPQVPPPVASGPAAVISAMEPSAAEAWSRAESIPPWESLPDDVPVARDVSAVQPENIAVTERVQHSSAEMGETQRGALAQAGGGATETVIPGFDGDWPSLAACLPVRGLAQQLAQQSELLRVIPAEAGLGYVCYLRVPVKQVSEGGALERLQQVLSEYFSVPIRLVLEVGAVRVSAAMVDAEAKAARQLAAEQAVANDPFVQGLMRDFGAALVADSIRPR